MVRRDRRGLTPIDEAMQELAWRSRHHPGQLAGSARYALPDELDHGPVALLRELRGRAGVALVEPVGCVPDHRGRGLAAAGTPPAGGGS